MVATSENYTMSTGTYLVLKKQRSGARSGRLHARVGPWPDTRSHHNRAARRRDTAYRIGNTIHAGHIMLLFYQPGCIVIDITH